VVGSGVTGVEFVHMFSCFGSEVSLIVHPSLAEAIAEAAE
jgi:pyruvate/2-oxoglutarate dehydrogenase complex dihydrolipoamide dehydrogenase (E3) component